MAYHKLAIGMYVEGSRQRSIGRILQVSPQRVANWITAYTNQLPPAEVPNTLRTAELEERYTLVGKKKTKSIS